jgi:hypothetical protein
VNQFNSLSLSLSLSKDNLFDKWPASMCNDSSRHQGSMLLWYLSNLCSPSVDDDSMGSATLFKGKVRSFRLSKLLTFSQCTRLEEAPPEQRNHDHAAAMHLPNTIQSLSSLDRHYNHLHIPSPRQRPATSSVTSNRHSP